MLSCLCLPDAFSIYFMDFSLYARPDLIDILLFLHVIQILFFSFPIFSTFVLSLRCFLSCCRILSTYSFAFAFRQWYVSFHFKLDVGKSAASLFITLSRCFQKKLHEINCLFVCCVWYFIFHYVNMYTHLSEQQAIF